MALRFAEFVDNFGQGAGTLSFGPGRVLPEMARVEVVTAEVLSPAKPVVMPHLSTDEKVIFADTIPADPSTTAVLTIGGTVDGLLDTVGDRDWFRVELVAGQRYTFAVGPTGTGDIEDSYLRLHNSVGTLIAENDDAGSLFSRLSFTATTSGTYYVSVGSYADAEQGNYRVSAVLAPPLTVFTNDQIATQLSETFWGGTERHFNVAPGAALTIDLSALTAAGQTLAREALALWTDATGINFFEGGGGPVHLRFIDDANDDPQGDADSAFATSTRVGGIIQSSLINVGTGWLTDYGTGFNTYSFQTYIHEIGHALGLGHAGNYNGAADYSTDAEYLNDSWATTIMSYFDQTENTYFSGQGFTRQFVLTPLVADIIATTDLYGTPSTTRTGDTTYGFNNNTGRIVFDAALLPSVTYTVVDHGGIDTLDYSGFSQNQRIDLNQEAFSNVGSRVGNVTIARGTVIENAVGGTGNDTIIGNSVANTLFAHRGGNDTLIGGGGDDGFYFGAAFNELDSVDGGTGTDQIGLQGNYANLILGANSTVGVELIVLLDGADNRFNGATGTNLSYNITTIDANIAAGQLFTFQANTLRAGENFTLNASAETNGTLLVFGGQGTDTITGGQGDDGFYFGTGRFNAADRVDGQGGSDQLGLQGNFAGGNALTLGATQLAGIELIVLLSASDLRFGGGNVGQNFSYTLTTHNGNVASGQQLVVQANSLGASEVLTFNGSAELDGRFIVYGGAGADSIIGGAGADELRGAAGIDRIEGLGGADVLYGGTGNDTFVYSDVQHSTAAARDQIMDFTTGDRIDLANLDANANAGGQQSFSLIASGAAFTAAGQLRITQNGNNALIEGEVNGNGVADFAIQVTVADGHILTIADFIGVVPGAEPLKLEQIVQLPDDEPYQGGQWDARYDPYLDMNASLGLDMGAL